MLVFNIVESLRCILNFMIKVLLVLEIYTFLNWLFVYVEKYLVKKAMINFKTYDVTQTGQQIITIHMFSLQF